MSRFAHRTKAIVRRVTIAGLSLTTLAALAHPSDAQTNGRNGAPASSARNSEYQSAVNAAYERYKDLREGKNADYIPALAKVDPNLFGIALVTVDGQVYTAGDVATQVSIQSISKVFTAARVLQDSGEAAILKNMGVDATGQVFNSIVAIEQHKGREMNPLVNPGAIAATSMVGGATADEVWRKIIGTYDAFAGRKLTVLDDVYRSEAETNQRNRAIGALMFAYGRIHAAPDQATDLYTRQCSVGVNARDLAVMAATLAAGGLNPITADQVLDQRYIAPLLAIMATAGLYDDSGKWLYTTGLPAKSGVGGGLIAVSPGKFGIAVISPPLDEAGNSVRAQKAIADISSSLGGNPYAVEPTRRRAARR
jgi:glutaminase